MCNDAAVCCGRIWLKCFVSVWSDLWKSLERESAMMFSVPLMCCEYRDVLLLTSVHPRQCATSSWDSVFTGSKDDLCIQPSALELSVNAKICDPCPIFRIVRNVTHISQLPDYLVAVALEMPLEALRLLLAMISSR